MRVLVFLLLTSLSLNAQFPRRDVSYMYTGEQLFHPGLKMGFDMETFNKSKPRVKSKRRL